MKCPECGHEADAHLVGIGCTEVVAWERDRGAGVGEQAALFDERGADSTGSPVICPCSRGMEGGKREARHEEVVSDQSQSE